MPHIIIITTPPPGGGNLVATEETANGSIEWKPSHDLTPNEQMRRTEKAEEWLAKIRDMLNAPPHAAE